MRLSRFWTQTENSPGAENALKEGSIPTMLQYAILRERERATCPAKVNGWRNRRLVEISGFDCRLHSIFTDEGHR
jgi:hypothetical protein